MGQVILGVDGTHSRNVTAVLGPTNTGKTHLAIERMLGHETGMIGLPLRLLAREVYDRICQRVDPSQVALITGEEKIKPEEARFYVCTVEAMPRDLPVAFLAIDEVQLAGDAERGHIFTDRLLHMRGQSETMLLGAATMMHILNIVLPGINVITRPRLSQISYAGKKKISRLPRRTAIVTFSASEVYAIAELVRRQQGGAAVVIGALSPRTRNAQVELYQSGEVDYLIATDAIGMGLNLDVDNVAFAATRKFDGRRFRDLSPAELSQIAGRAGRHLNDGTFGVTGDVDIFDPQLIEQLETHSFQPIKALQWRNNRLNFSSLKALLTSLSVLPNNKALIRSGLADDLAVLEILSTDEEVIHNLKNKRHVQKLWEVCQMPDFKKISINAHAELVKTVFMFLMSPKGRIPEDWFARQISFAERTDGNIDSLSQRVAHIRTWTFVSHHPDWLENADYWQERSHEIENKLSDALHLCLTKQFVDHKTSTLLRKLRDNEELFAEIGHDGKLYVENHAVGKISGFRFAPLNRNQTTQGKAARNAASKVLTQAMIQKAEELLKASDASFVLTRTGAITWKDEAIGRLAKGASPLSPDIILFADESLPDPQKGQVEEKLKTWITSHIETVLNPLVKLQKAEEISGLAKGVAFQIIESLGSLKRESIANDIKQLDQTARAQLRKYGVRFGAFNIYIPILLKPAAAELILLLTSTSENPADEEHAFPEPPAAGLTSVKADKSLNERQYRACGYHLCGERAVRIDMLERLSEMIRPLLAYNRDKKTPLPEGATGFGSFRIQTDMLSILGCSMDEMTNILKSLNFQMNKRVIPQKKKKIDTAQELQVSKAAAEMLSPYLNISGLSFEPEVVDPDAEEEVLYDELWKPRRKYNNNNQNNRKKPDQRARNGARPGRDGKRRDGGNFKKDGYKGKKRSNDRGRNNAGGGKGKQSYGSSRPKKVAVMDPDSPFAALMGLKNDLKDKQKKK